MKETYFAFVEHCRDTGLYVGTLPALPGARAQGRDLHELAENLAEVAGLVLEEMAANGESPACGQAVCLLPVEVDLP